MSAVERKGIAAFVAIVVSATLGYVAFSHSVLATVLAGTIGLGLAVLTLLFVSVSEDEEAKKAAVLQQKATAEDALSQRPGDVTAIAQLNMAKLDEYYALNKSQARNSFAASIAAVSVGFVAILISIRFGSGQKFATGAVSGVLLQFIGGAVSFALDCFITHDLKCSAVALLAMQAHDELVAAGYEVQRV